MDYSEFMWTLAILALVRFFISRAVDWLFSGYNRPITVVTKQSWEQFLPMLIDVVDEEPELLQKKFLLYIARNSHEQMLVLLQYLHWPMLAMKKRMPLQFWQLLPKLFKENGINIEDIFSEQSVIGNGKEQMWLLLIQFQGMSSDVIGNIRLKYETLSEGDICRICRKNGQWDLAVRKQILSEDFLRKHQQMLNWRLVCRYQRLSEKFLYEMELLIHWPYVARYQRKLSEDFLRQNCHRLHWIDVFTFHRELSENFLQEFADSSSWKIILYYQKLSKEFLLKHEQEFRLVDNSYYEKKLTKYI